MHIFSCIRIYVTTSSICVHIPVYIQVTQQDLIDVLDDDNASVWVGVQDLLALAQVIDRRHSNVMSVTTLKKCHDLTRDYSPFASLNSFKLASLTLTRSLTHSHAR